MRVHQITAGFGFDGDDRDYPAGVTVGTGAGAGGVGVSVRQPAVFWWAPDHASVRAGRAS
jgi:hypothetical protein